MITQFDINQLERINREGDSVYAVFRTGTRQTFHTTRFRHHGPRKFRRELAVQPTHERVLVNKAQSLELLKAAKAAGRTIERIKNDAVNSVLVWG